MTDQSRATLLTTAKPWPDVEDFYRSLASDERWRVDALLALVRFIRAQEWHTAVFPTTSHEMLCLARHSTFVWGEDMLQVTPAGDRLAIVHVTRADAELANVSTMLGTGITAADALGVVRLWSTTE